MKEDDDDIQEYVGSRQKALEKEYNYERNIRNQTIEKVAKEIEKMTAFGKDTTASFAVYIRNMKQ
jgi:hypothetical protein